MTDIATMRTIAQLVPRGARVLDLGCGDGAMLAHLQKTRACTGYGIEIADANVLACVKRGVNVIQLNLDEGLAMFDDARHGAGGPGWHRCVSQFCALA
jgi:methionine biosynthesis protein MetW